MVGSPEGEDRLAKTRRENPGVVTGSDSMRERVQISVTGQSWASVCWLLPCWRVRGKLVNSVLLPHPVGAGGLRVRSLSCLFWSSKEERVSNSGKGMGKLALS